MDWTVSDPLFDVEGRVVAITGACGRIGKPLAHLFHERGAHLLLTDVQGSAVNRFAAEMRDNAIAQTCDVSKPAEVRAAVDLALGRWGRIDVLINSHQYRPRGWSEASAEDISEDLWDAIVNVNLKGTFLTCQEFGRVMLSRGKGSIINLASTYGVVSSNPALYDENSLGNPVAYTASKGGVIMLTKYLGVHWGARGVRVNCVTPHGVASDQEASFIERFSSMSPMARLMRVEEIFGAILFLASDASSYATGSNLLVEGGWTAW
jgi:NAD(P)-dependent dehydrogenase (short-subunit alcohol dehydrogenase family)